MTEFWGMVLCATAIGIGLTVAVAVVYCGFIAACHYCKKRHTEPLSTVQDQV
jgi:hypothetical protein